MVSTADSQRGPDRESPADLGRFVRLDTLGAGGMGKVYSAWDRQLQRRVAIKILHSDDRERSLREAQALARLKHPNVVTVHDVGSWQGVDYIAMELVDGCSLREWLSKSRPRAWREILAVYRQAGRGLEAAHAAGLVHRDFKPDNVLIGDDGSVRVADFGLARATAEHTPTPEPVSADVQLLEGSLTRTGALVGTPRYMAPEQRAGKRPDPSMDQYSFAISLWESLFGRLVGETGPQPALPIATGRVPAWLRTALERAMAPEPARRFPSLGGAPRRLRPRSLVPPAGGDRRRDPGRRRGGRADLAAPGRTRRSSARGRAQAGRGVDPAARQEVQAAFAGRGRRERRRHLLRASRRRSTSGTAAWVAMRTDACEATALRHEQLSTPPRSAPAMPRLPAERGARARRRLRARRPAGGRQRGRRGLPARRSALRAPTPARAPLGATALPGQSGRPRQRGRPARPSFSRFEAVGAAGRYQEAEAKAKDIIAAARATGYAPLLGEALLLLSFSQMSLYEDQAAEVTLEEAMVVLAVAKDDARVVMAWARLINVLGVGQSRPVEALALRTGAESALARAGGDRRLRALLDRNLALVLKIQGKYDEALALQKETLALQLELLDPRDPQIGNTRNSVGVLLMYQGKYDEALAQFEATLAFFKRVYGPEHPSVAGILINIGELHLRQGRYAEAAPVLEQALAIQEKTVGADHPDVAETLGDLGTARLRQGDVEGARRHFERALAIDQAKLPADHLEVAASLRRAGDVLVADGEPAAGRADIDRALAIYGKKLDPPGMGEAYASLGGALAALGKLDEAGVAYANALWAIEAHDHGGVNEAAAETEGRDRAVDPGAGDRRQVPRRAGRGRPGPRRVPAGGGRRASRRGHRACREGRGAGRARPGRRGHPARRAGGHPAHRGGVAARSGARPLRPGARSLEPDAARRRARPRARRASQAGPRHRRPPGEPTISDRVTAWIAGAPAARAGH